jgi:hypothetical protein
MQPLPASCHFISVWYKKPPIHFSEPTSVFVLPVTQETELDTHTKQQIKLCLILTKKLIEIKRAKKF